MAQQLQEGDRVEVQTPNGVWYRGTVIKFGVFDGLQVWLDQLPFGLTSHRVVSVPDIRRLPNQPPRPVSYLEMVAATFPAGVEVKMDAQYLVQILPASVDDGTDKDEANPLYWVIARTASEEYPYLLLRQWLRIAKAAADSVFREVQVPVENTFNFLRRTGLPARSKLFRLGI